MPALAITILLPSGTILLACVFRFCQPSLFLSFAMSNHQTVQVLLVEDDEIDAEAVKRAFRKQRIANPIHLVPNGLEALNVLRGTNGVAPLQRPHLVLLDLNMPKMGGLEFLEELRKDPQLRDTIVFVLTTSDADRDKISAYGKNVAGYVLKSRVGEDFINLVNVIDHYWRYVEFPPAQESGPAPGAPR